MAFRFDHVAIRTDKVARLPSGGVRVDAVVTAPGVFTYHRADGTPVREWRPPEEVFSADSLASLRDVPVTVGHPRDLVTPTSYAKYAAGHLAGDARKDADGVGMNLVAARSDAVEGVMSGKLADVSMGYSVELDETPGVTPTGERYDRVQRKIVYNHAALLPRGDGRQGTARGVRLDAKGDALREDCGCDGGRVDAALPWDECMAKAMAEYGDEATARKVCGAIKAQNDKKDTKMQITLKVDGKDVQTEAGSQDHLTLQRRIDEARDAELAKVTARADAADAALKKANEALAAFEADKAKAARDALERAARGVLGADAKFDGKSDRDLMVAVVKHTDSAFTGEGRPDAYVQARFDIAIETPKRASADGDTSRRDALASVFSGAPAKTTGAQSGEIDPYVDPVAYVEKCRADAAKLHLRNATAK